MRLGRRRTYHYRSHSSVGGIFSLLFLLILAAGGFLAYQLYLGGQFNRAERYNFVIAGSKVLFISFDRSEKSLTTVVFPQDLYITQVAHGYGQYPVSKIYGAGELDHRGGIVLADTVSDYLGVPVNGYVYEKGVAGDIRSYLFHPLFLLTEKSNLNLLDRMQFLLAVLTIRGDKWQSVDLSQWTGPLVLADGSQVTSLDTETVDNELSGRFAESDLRAENLRLEVVNSTQYSGLGAEVARILTNVGLSVVAVSQSDLPLSRCQVQYQPKAKNSLTVARLVSVFNCQAVAASVSGRSDVTMVVGQEYIDKLTK